MLSAPCQGFVTVTNTLFLPSAPFMSNPLRFAVTAQLVRETTAGVYVTVTASRRKVYPDAEVDQWHRTAEAAQYAAVTATRTKTYADIEV